MGKRGVIAMIQEILNALVAVTNVLSFLIKVAEKIHRFVKGRNAQRMMQEEVSSPTSEDK